MIIVTGGAGFIGSCIVRELNDMGYTDILIVDHIQKTEKWKNLSNKIYTEYMNRDDFLVRLPEFEGRVSHVIHMGACSSTTETDFDFLYQNNFAYTKALWNFCTDARCSFLYASSAATYGAGEYGFDDRMDIQKLRPLNGYGYSKQLFDLWVQKQERAPKQHVGFKFFNVYGMNIARGVWQVLSSIHSRVSKRQERWGYLSPTVRIMQTGSSYGTLYM